MGISFRDKHGSYRKLKYLSDGTNRDSFGVRMKKLRIFEDRNVGFAGKAKNEDFEADSRSDHSNRSMANLMSLNTLICYIRSLQTVPTPSKQNPLFWDSVSPYCDQGTWLTRKGGTRCYTRVPSQVKWTKHTEEIKTDHLWSANWQKQAELDDKWWKITTYLSVDRVRDMCNMRVEPKFTLYSNFIP